MIATIFDTETTHVISNHVIKLDRQPHVLEIYACHVNLEKNMKIDEIEYLIRPPKESDIDLEVAEKSHHITWDMVKDKPTFAMVVDPIMTFLSRGDAIVAHNLSFDMEMIEIEAERTGRKMFWPPRKICTLEQTTWVNGTWLKLEELHSLLLPGEEFVDKHRARSDVMALVRCCVKMRRRGWI